MKEIRVMIADDNEELRSQIAECLQQSPAIQVVGEAENGLSALKIMSDVQPNILILDMVMPIMDGFSVLSRLQQMEATQRPKVIAITALSRDDFILRAIAMGADDYLIKPVNLELLTERVVEIAQMADHAPDDAQGGPLKDFSLDERLSNLFLALGIPAHIKGYQFLREAVKQVILKPGLISAITKELYPSIARKFSTTPSKVERAIRHAIEVAWSRGRVDTLNKAFGSPVVFQDARPTNGEFIALIADKLMSQMEMKAI